MSTAPRLPTSIDRTLARKRVERRPLALVQAEPAAVGRFLPRLIPVERRGAVLRPNPLSQAVEGEVLGLNLTSGCPHQCGYCFARAYPGGEASADLLGFYADTARRLDRELKLRSRLPRAVYLSPSSDPFPPYAEVQAEVGRVLEVLARWELEVWFMTRGFIRPLALGALARHRQLVKVTIGLTTLDRRLSRTLEPLAAPPRLRLKQLARLREQGIHTRVAIEPLIPGLTDTRNNLEPLLDALAAEGVESIAAGYLFMRRGIQQNLETAMPALAPGVVQAFQGGPIMPMGTAAPARHLPRPLRQKGYALLMALAASRNMRVTINQTTNPDFTRPRPASASSPESFRQLVLRYDAHGTDR